MIRYDVALMAGEDPKGSPVRWLGRNKTYKQALHVASAMAESLASGGGLRDYLSARPVRVALRTIKGYADVTGGDIADDWAVIEATWIDAMHIEKC